MAALNVLILINGISGVVAFWWGSHVPDNGSAAGLFVGGFLCLACAIWLDVYVKPRVKGEKK